MRKLVISGLLIFLVLLPFSASGTELGLTSYPDGIENFFAGAFPPPGSYLQNYWLFYKAGEFQGGPPNPKAFVFVEAVRFIYSSKITFLGANWGTHIVVPLVYTSLNSKVPGMVIVDDQRFGFGNTAFDPIILAWHFGEFHVTSAFETQFPGSYNPNNPASASRNYFTFEPILAFAWLPKCGMEFNIKMMYDFPTRNNNPLTITGAKDSYQSGQAFHFDYCIDYAVRPNLRLGVAGYYYTQTTGDIVDGTDIGFHGREFALGPAIKYDYGRFSFCVINQFELAAINRPEGVRNWVRVWYAF
jgi:hypothetical protein